jgi:branched-chain amino acid transport system ATP-binding protein
MLAIARAMVSQPYLLLLDEPTASLAPNLVSEIIEKLEEIRKKDGTSILLVEQNALKSLKVSDRGYVLVTGKKVFEGDAKNILENRDIGKLYLGIKK